MRRRKSGQGTNQACTVDEFWLVGNIHRSSLVEKARVDDRDKRVVETERLGLLEQAQRKLDVVESVSKVRAHRQCDEFILPRSEI